MNRLLKLLRLILLIEMMFFISCSSTVDEPDTEEKPMEKEVIVQTQVPEEPQENTITEEPEQEVIKNDETGFEISKEVYESTRDEISELISNLNRIISDRNYEKWKLFLSESYIKTYNDPVKLKQFSEQSQILSQNGIVLKNLKDYFEWVVVPSRSSARVDDIVFIDDTLLIVYMKIKEKNTILYQLEKIEDDWQISVW